MHSRAYFVLRTVLFVILAAIVLIFAFFLLSFVFFSLDESGIRYLLEFDQQGLVTFISLFPWTSLLVFVGLIITLELIIRRFEFAYRFPLIRIFAWILIVGIAGSAVVGFTPFHSSLLSAADNDQLPILGPIYEQIHDSRQAEGIYRGRITYITETEFTLEHDDDDRDKDEGTWTIIPPKDYHLTQLSAGDRVYVAGTLKDDLVYAYGIHRLGHGKRVK
jgi:glucan phosphoethanolaminetransferase (alkaline phosphatase superfamily)